MINILYFGSLVDAFDRASDELDLPPQVQDVQSLLFFLSLRGEPWARYLRNNPGLKITAKRCCTQHRWRRRVNANRDRKRKWEA